jgi:hypothetical protein
VVEVCSALGFENLVDDVAGFVRRTFVLPVVDAGTGIRVDFIFSSTPYEREAIRRSDVVRIRGIDVRFASAEDLILHKLFAGRPRDLEDAENVARRKGSSLDWGYMEAWASAFADVPGREELPDQIARLREAEEAD